ncbi:MAG: hypothetical protein WC615_11950 [Mucilaginibacter sp.]|jgi:hypothetical protein|uniref:hypothetical protein n=1 Tax=Mucilaginibacter sp. TaxID=1882438 RepID=UPI003567F0E3
MKKLILLCLVFAVVTSSCSKKLKTDGCPTDQICTMMFASIGTQFVDKDGNNVAVKDFKVFNTRTNKYISVKGIIDNGSEPSHYTIVTDGNKKELSTTGDELRITASNISTNKPISVAYKISGGCNCHVEKLSGPEKIVLE